MEHPGEGHNDALAWLGDTVLGLIVTEALYGRSPKEETGTLTRAYDQVVDNERLASVARTLGLGQTLRLGQGEEAQRGRENTTNLASLFEACLGAVYLDAGYAAAKALAERHLSLKARLPALVRPAVTAPPRRPRRR